MKIISVSSNFSFFPSKINTKVKTEEKSSFDFKYSKDYVCGLEAYNFPVFQARKRRNIASGEIVAQRADEFLNQDDEFAAAKLLSEFYSRKNKNNEFIGVQGVDLTTKGLGYNYQYKVSDNQSILISKNKIALKNGNKLFEVKLNKNNSVDFYEKNDCFAYRVNDFCQKVNDNFFSENIDECVDLMCKFYKENGGLKGIREKIEPNYKYKQAGRRNSRDGYELLIETNKGAVALAGDKIAVLFSDFSSAMICLEFTKKLKPYGYYARNYSTDAFCFESLYGLIPRKRS